MRVLFAVILLVHGLIHLMGFAKAFKLADVPQLSGNFSKPAGMLWLLTGLLFVVSVLLFFVKKDWWWMPAVPAIVLSQILIFTHWHDARFGTNANILALAGVVLAYGAWSYHAMVENELKAFMPDTLPPKAWVTKDRLATVPPVVQKWMERSNVIGKEVVYVAHLKQTGEMMTKPDGKWIPFEAEQYNTLDKPGFIWTTEMQTFPGIYITGRDKYQNGRGNMLIKLMSIFPIADAKGPETDQGTMLRNLAEICWFPSAALNDYIQWEQIDSLTARATMTWGGITAPGIFRFGADGDLLSFEAQRYYDRKDGPTLEDWLVKNTGWKDMNGIRIPFRSEITWKLKTGDFTWLKLEIRDLEFNKI